MWVKCELRVQQRRMPDIFTSQSPVTSTLALNTCSILRVTCVSCSVLVIITDCYWSPKKSHAVTQQGVEELMDGDIICFQRFVVVVSYIYLHLGSFELKMNCLNLQNRTKLPRLLSCAALYTIFSCSIACWVMGRWPHLCTFWIVLVETSLTVNVFYSRVYWFVMCQEGCTSFTFSR